MNAALGIADRPPAIAPPEPEETIGGQLHALAGEFFPICRSLTGDGVRRTLDIVERHIPLRRHSVPSGSALFDWTVPPEWVIRDAFVKDGNGQRVVDFHRSNLHVVGYSMPVRRKMTLADLKPHIHTLPDRPGLIPYRTAYHERDWGFCMSHDAFLGLTEGMYDVCIDSELVAGELIYGEHVHQGDSASQFLISTHICHPSMANDNCSGMAVLTHVARALEHYKTRYTYRFLFSPGTLGPLAWLAANESRTHLVEHGLVVAGVGDAGGPTYKRSRRGNAFIDRALAHLLKHEGGKARVIDFSPYGYDERQFCSPGFDMPVGLLQNSPFGTFEEYHTSADDLDFIHPDHLERSFRLVMAAIDIVEREWTPVSLCQKGEPQLGRRGLYATKGGSPAGANATMAMLWVLNLSDGAHGLLDIAERSGLRHSEIADAAGRLHEAGLLRPA